VQPKSAALSLLAGLLLTAGHAAEPEFKTSLVIESRVYEREAGSFSIGGLEAGKKTTTTSRVTVVLDGTRITGEWVPKTATASATAKDFPRGSDVPAAATRNQLRLKLPDGSVVTAKIVKRERQPADDTDDKRD
jgi:hypothetical protein